MITIMTFNVANFNNHDGWYDFRCRNITRVLNQIQPDIVCFQQLRSGNPLLNENMLKEMLRRLDYEWNALWTPIMEYKTLGFTTNKEGLGILSKL